MIPIETPLDLFFDWGETPWWNSVKRQVKINVNITKDEVDITGAVGGGLKETLPGRVTIEMSLPLESYITLQGRASLLEDLKKALGTRGWRVLNGIRFINPNPILSITPIPSTNLFLVPTSFFNFFSGNVITLETLYDLNLKDFKYLKSLKPLKVRPQIWSKYVDCSSYLTPLKR